MLVLVSRVGDSKESCEICPASSEVISSEEIKCENQDSYPKHHSVSKCKGAVYVGLHGTLTLDSNLI